MIVASPKHLTIKPLPHSPACPRSPSLANAPQPWPTITRKFWAKKKPHRSGAEGLGNLERRRQFAD